MVDDRIPKDLLHEVPTTLLFSMEGMQMKGLNWEKILRFQCDDGSLLNSPSSTAFVLMQTKDRRCLNYLNDVVQRSNGGGNNTKHKSYPLSIVGLITRFVSRPIALLVFKCSAECIPSRSVRTSVDHRPSTKAWDLAILQGKARRIHGLCLKVVKKGII